MQIILLRTIILLIELIEGNNVPWQLINVKYTSVP